MRSCCLRYAQYTIHPCLFRSISKRHLIHVHLVCTQFGHKNLTRIEWHFPCFIDSLFPKILKVGWVTHRGIYLIHVKPYRSLFFVLVPINLTKNTKSEKAWLAHCTSKYSRFTFMHHHTTSITCRHHILSQLISHLHTIHRDTTPVC